MHVIKRGLFFLAVALIALGIMRNRADAAPPPSSRGDVVIHEVMVDPDAAADSVGEWIELLNPTSSTFDLDGLVLRDDDLDYHIISGTLLIGPGWTVVLGNNGDPQSNGGYVANYVYSYNDFRLGNTGDEIVISAGETEIARLDYSSNFDIAGTAMELRPDEIDPYTIESYYDPATIPYGLGDFGTPTATFPEAVPSISFGGLALLAGLMLGIVGWARRR